MIRLPYARFGKQCRAGPDDEVQDGWHASARQLIPQTLAVFRRYSLRRQISRRSPKPATWSLYCPSLALRRDAPISRYAIYNKMMTFPANTPVWNQLARCATLKASQGR